MTPKERAAIQQALEALEQYHYTLISAGVLDKQHVLNQGFTAHAALREALAEQAEQEPVAWMYDWEFDGKQVKDWVTSDINMTGFNNGHNVRPLYAAPVRTKDLTDDEIAKEMQKLGYGHTPTNDELKFARAVIAKYKEKNK